MTAPANLQAEELQRLGDRLVGLGSAAHPAGLARGEQFASSLLRGVPAHQALLECGAKARVARFVEVAAPRELGVALDGLATSLGRYERRARGLSSYAGYVWLVGAASLAALAVLQVGVVPAMNELAHAGKDPLVPLQITRVLPLLVSASCIATLVAFGFMLATRRVVFPFAQARLGQERALVIAAAATAAQAGVDLATALRAAGELTVHPPLRAEAEALAASLEKGAAEGGALLLGELGASLFAGAVGQGVGPQTLAALAAFEEAAAQAGWPRQELKAELLALLLGGLAVASAGAALMLTYSGALLQ